MANLYRRRRVGLLFVVSLIIGTFLVLNSPQKSQPQPSKQTIDTSVTRPLARAVVETLAVKGRAPKTEYSRTQFGDGWITVKGCDTRNIILNRDMTNVQTDDSCNVISGTLNDPYTGKSIQFKRGSGTSNLVQIDHVVALSDAWQKGAQQLTRDQRVTLANDPLELLAVDGPANQQKSDGDAATWLPSYKPFRCQYVARQIAIKQKYGLWVTQSEKDAIKNILSNCPLQTLPVN